MNKALEDMLRPYAPITPLDWEHATREIVQEIALLGLWRSGFFEQASFYGGTALRIFHGLNRFSEDLDFSLEYPANEPRLKSALAALETEMASWGFSFQAESNPPGDRTAIESAFLKGNTHINLLNIGVPAELSRHFLSNQKITIKLELDTKPPPFAETEVKTHLMPTPFQVRLYDLPSFLPGSCTPSSSVVGRTASRCATSTTSSGSWGVMYQLTFRISRPESGKAATAALPNWIWRFCKPYCANDSRRSISPQPPTRCVHFCGTRAKFRCGLKSSSRSFPGV